MVQEALKEMKNGFKIVGTLKTKDLRIDKTKSGKEAIMGNVVVEIAEAEKTHNIRVEVFSMRYKKDSDEESGLFKGYKTVMDEYIAKDDDSQNADVIEVSGSIDVNDYINRDGNLRTSNRNRALFFERVDKDSKQQALATVEAVITGYVDKTDADGIPTDETKVKAATVGYGGKIIPLENLVINKDLEAMREAYFEGTTGTLTIKMNNYPVEKEQESADIVGFGLTEDQTRTVVNYVSNLQIVGGSYPDTETGLTEEQIKQMSKDRETQLSEVQQPKVSAQTVEKISGGFGVNKEDIPAF
jgi:hypothetical protein